MFGMGAGELALIVLLLLLLFGAKRIPEIAKGLGSGIRTFKGELKKPDEPEHGELEEGERSDEPRSLTEDRPRE